MIITVRPDIIIQAKQAKLPVRYFWLWQYSKHICKAGGTIPEQALKESLEAIGISKTSRCDWINDSVRLGLLTLEVSERTGLVYYRLASWEQGAKIAGCKHVGAPVSIELERFVSRSWMPEIWAAYQLQSRGRTEKLALLSKDKNTGTAVVTVVERKAKPISRAKLTEITGVSRRAQQYREKKAGVEQVENYLVGCSGVGYHPYGHDKEQPGLHAHGGVELLRLPNSRAVPERIQLSRSNSRTKKANKRLKALWQCDAIAKGETFTRVYADNFEQAMKLPGDGIMYPTGKYLPSKQGEPIKQTWRRLHYES